MLGWEVGIDVRTWEPRKAFEQENNVIGVI